MTVFADAVASTARPSDCDTGPTGIADGAVGIASNGPGAVASFEACDDGSFTVGMFSGTGSIIGATASAVPAVISGRSAETADLDVVESLATSGVVVGIVRSKPADADASELGIGRGLTAGAVGVGDNGSTVPASVFTGSALGGSVVPGLTGSG